jgi:hypothetical protein
MKSPAAPGSRLVLLAATVLALAVVGLAPAAANAAPVTVDPPNRARSTVVDCNFGTSCDWMVNTNDATSSEWWLQDRPRD